MKIPPNKYRITLKDFGSEPYLILMCRIGEEEKSLLVKPDTEATRAWMSELVDLANLGNYYNFNSGNP